MAAIWNLPTVFLCENNQYDVTTHFREEIPTENISDRAVAYNMPGVLVDGQDVLAMYAATKQAVTRARAGEGPSFLEARTYRYEEHAEGLERILTVPYRTEEEVEMWRQRDPIDLHMKNLLEQEIATQKEIDQVQQDVAIAVEDALEFARNSPYPEARDVYDDLYGDPIATPVDVQRRIERRNIEFKSD